MKALIAFSDDVADDILSDAIVNSKDVGELCCCEIGSSVHFISSQPLLTCKTTLVDRMALCHPVK